MCLRLLRLFGGRTKIDGDPLAVRVDLAIDALFFQWLARNADYVGRVLYASSSAAYPDQITNGNRSSRITRHRPSRSHLEGDARRRAWDLIFARQRAGG